ncbi:MAG: AraC family transcriptional regulator [Oscillospiraceae bacterium]|nr:AraC family transcriptional regulator [Oscillospiraceae bacterium]
MQDLSYELDFSPESVWNIFATTPAAKSNFVYLQEVGHFFAGKRYYTTRQGLDSFLLKLTISGGGILEYGNHKIHAGPGHFYWIDCTHWQSYYTDPDIGHWNVIWVHFNGATARAYYEAYRKLQGGVLGTLPKDSSMLTLMEKLLNRPPLSPEHSLPGEQSLFEFDVQTSGLLTQLLVECVSSAGISRKMQHLPPMVNDMRNYLTARYTEKVTLDHLAAEFSLDPHYLQKLFKKHLGQSPMEYIIYLRIIRAKNLLRTSNMTISQIAYSAGVDNVSHFTRQFKRHEGMTPSQYRKVWFTR